MSKYFMADILFALLYVLVLLLGIFGFVNYLAVSIILFLLLVLTIIYKFAVIDMAESVSSKFIHQEKIKEAKIFRRRIINALIGKIDYMNAKIIYMNMLLKGEVLILE